MSTLHLKQGSPFPPLKDDVLRVYSMKFCPFAERTLLALAYKKIPHEIVNINLRPVENKPDWFLERAPLGLVPVLEKNGKIVYDSKICNYYLDEVYPENKLVPDDPLEKAKINMMMELFSKVIGSFYGILRNASDEKALAEGKTNLRAALKPFEDDLNAPFFGGSKIGMLDILIWPIFERMGAVDSALKNPVVTSENGFPKLAKWVERMFQTEVVKSQMFTTEDHIKFMVSHAGGNPDYDGIP